MTASPPPSVTPSAGPRDGPSFRTHLLAYGALAALAIVIYSNSFSDGFSLDSSFVILRDPRITSATNPHLQQIFTKDYWFPNFNSGLFRPVSTLSFLLNYSILGNGKNPAGYHAFNLALHILNGWLLFALAWRFLRRLSPAVLAAALWVAHPVATEAVTNLVGRCDELAATAILGGVLLYIRAVRVEGWLRWFYVPAIFLVSLAGLFSKEIAVGLIAMMALWDVVRGPGTFGEWLRRRWPYYAAVALSLALFVTARSFVFQAAPPSEFPVVDNPLVAAPFWIGRLTAMKVLFQEFGLLFFPLNLTCDRSYNQIPLAYGFDVRAWAGVALVAFLLGLVFLRRRKDPLMFWCAGFFGIALLPVSNLAVTIGSIMAERFLYLPAAAFSIAISVLLHRWLGRKRAQIVLGIVIAAFGVRTFVRNPDWKDDKALSTHDVKVVPASFKLHGLVAKSLYEESHANIDAAIVEAEKAWEIVKQLPPIQVFTQTPTNLGTLYRIKGDMLSGARNPGAVEFYRRAISVLSEAKRDSQLYADDYDNRQEREGKPMTVRLERADLYLNLGLAYHSLGMYQQARDALIYGRTLNPNNLEFYNVLAANYVDGGNPAWAAISMEEKVMLDGGQPNTVAQLRTVLEKVPNSSCMIQMENGKAKLNIGCAATNMCIVWTDLAQAFFRARKHDDAIFLKKSAVEHGCSANLLEFAAPGS